MGGGGFIQDMLTRAKENRATLPSKRSKRTQYMEGRKSTLTKKQNIEKVKSKEVSDNELVETIYDTKRNIIEEIGLLPLTVLIAIAIFILIIFVF